LAVSSGSTAISAANKSAPAMPSIMQWWALMTTAKRSPASPSMNHISHSGRLALSGCERMRPARPPLPLAHVAGPRHRGMADVIAQVEVLVVDPDRPPEQRDGRQALAKPRPRRQCRLDLPEEPREIEAALRGPQRRQVVEADGTDVHGGCRPLEIEKCLVRGREPFVMRGGHAGFRREPSVPLSSCTLRMLVWRTIFLPVPRPPRSAGELADCSQTREAWEGSAAGNYRSMRFVDTKTQLESNS